MKSFEEFRDTTKPVPKEVKDCLYGDFDPHGPAVLITNEEIDFAWNAAYFKYCYELNQSPISKMLMDVSILAGKHLKSLRK